MNSARTPGLIAELQRRNVIRVGVLYVISAWVTLQVADVGVSLLGLPHWTGRMVALLLAIGFPLALVFSWIYELTPDGLRREHTIPRDASISEQTGRRINVLIGVVAALAILTVAADRIFPRADSGARTTSGVASVAKVVPSPLRGPSIAVLPFVNMSEDAANVYFSEGLSEELINTLARLPNLRVIGRTSSFQFRDRPEDLRVIAGKLGVAHVLEGSVRKIGDRVRVNAQLVSAIDGAELWSGSYERSLGDAFAIQDEIVGDVVKALRVRLLDTHASSSASPSDPEAYALVLRGHYFLEKNTTADLRKAEALYREAVRRAPDYAKAWAGLAAVYYAQTSYGHLPVATGLQAIRSAAEKALSLDPDLVAGHYVMASLQMNYDWDWAAAEASLNRAHALAPGDPAVLRQAGTLKLTQGRVGEAIALDRQSLELDPLDLTTLNNLAIAQYYAGHLDDGEATVRKLMELAPQSDGASYLLGLIALARDRPQDALDAFARESGEVWRLQGRALALHALGQPAAADAAMAALERKFGADSAFQIAEARAFRGETDAAFAWLDRAYAQRDGGLAEIRGDPLLRRLENDPRHAAFLRRMRLQ
jgi:adenylate cyclase